MLLFKQFSCNLILKVYYCRCKKMLLLRHGKLLLFCRFSECTLYRTLASNVKLTASLDPAVESAFEDNQKVKHHPGIRNVKCVQLPDRLHKTATKILTKHESKTLKENGDRFVQHLNRRMLPPDDQQVKTKAKDIEEEVIQRKKIQFETLSEADRTKAEERVKNATLHKLRQMVYHWKPIEYSSSQSYLYLYGKLASNYAVLKKVFSEIKAEVPEFAPKTVFDFGSGLGTVIWATNDAWGDKIAEYFCVDASDDMNNLARLLLQDGKEGGESFLKGLFFRQFLPASTNLKYDLVVSAWSLLDLPSIQQRLEVIDNLWARTQNLLVLIEYGSNAGFSAVLEARDYILNKSTNTGAFSDCQDEIQPVSVVCPCPHDLECPRYYDNSGTPCNFSVQYMKLSLKNSKQEIADERFSYVVLQKKFRSPHKEHWPRIVRNVLKRSGHVVCRMCCSDGKLNEVIFTKSKQSKTMYQCARASNWGDLLPAKVYERPDDNDSATDEETTAEEAIKS